MSYQSNYLHLDLQKYSTVFTMDWSVSAASEISCKQKGDTEIKFKRISSDIKSLSSYFKGFKGPRLLVFEESTGAQWLYVQLRRIIDRIVICDPYRNALLKEGPKTDRIDSFKLMHLLYNNSLREVYHSASSLYELRTFMSGYEDLVKAIVRLKNQCSGLKRASGFRKGDKDYQPGTALEAFVYRQQQDMLGEYELKKKLYEKEMTRLTGKFGVLKRLQKISGIGPVIALTILSRVVDGSRFANKNKYYGYCGLVRHPRDSGKSIRGYSRGHYNPRMRWAYKSAAMAAIGGKSDIHDYYMYLLGTGLSEPTARNEIARYLARVSLALMKNGSDYKPYAWRKKA